MADKLKTNYLDGDDFTPKDINATNEAINKNTDSIADLQTQIGTTANNLKTTQEQVDNNKKAINTVQGQIGSYKLWAGTESQYNALTKDANTLYFITE